MIKLISFLITGCWHHWTSIREDRVFEHSGSERPCGTYYVLQCSKCGNIKGKKVLA